MIEADGLAVQFPGGARVGPMSMKAGPGVTLVTGPSGCGKSTLLRSLLGILPNVFPAEMDGTALVGERAPSEIAPDQIARAVGYVPQDLQPLTPTPWQEIALPLEFMRLEPNETRRRVATWLRRFGIEALADREQSTLSGGEQARVLLAAALAPEPGVLLLDEPMAQLDPEGQRQFLDALRLVPSETTVLAITHLPELWTLPHRMIHLAAADKMSLPILPAPASGKVVAQLRGARVTARGLPATDLTIRRGETLALVGLNGCGKSTLLWMLAGLVAPTSGEVSVLGQEPRSWTPLERARHLGLSFQDPAWHITQDTVGEEVRLTLDVLGKDTKDVARWLERFRLTDLVDRHPWDLSGGQRQRLAMVTALAHGPDLALLDEPTRGMDQHHRAAILDTLIERQAAEQATIVVTHDAQMIAAIENVHRLEAPA